MSTPTPTPSPPPSVSVVVPVRDMEATVESCARALLAQLYPEGRWEIVFVDNASRDRTREVLSRLPVRCVEEAVPGPAAARNRGILESSGEVVAFTDADCVPARGWLPALVAELGASGVRVAAGPVAVVDPSRSAIAAYSARTGRYDPERSLRHPRFPYAPTGNMAVRRETLEAVGLFDPAFRTYEGADLAYRLHRRGLFSASVARRAIVFYHPRAGLAGFVRQSLAYGRDYARFFHKHRDSLELAAVRWPGAGAACRRRIVAALPLLRGGDQGPTLLLLHLFRETASMLGSLSFHPHREGGR